AEVGDRGAARQRGAAAPDDRAGGDRLIFQDASISPIDGEYGLSRVDDLDLGQRRQNEAWRRTQRDGERVARSSADGRRQRPRDAIDDAAELVEVVEDLGIEPAAGERRQLAVDAEQLQ